MAKTYKRCTDGSCDPTMAGDGFKPDADKETDPAKRYYVCKTNEDKPCFPKKNKCMCYVVLGHYKLMKGKKEEDDTAELTEDEQAFKGFTPGGLETGRLTLKDWKDKFNEGKPLKDETWWSRSCNCLKIDDNDDPLVAMRVELQVPDEKYGQALAMLREEFGTERVSLLAPESMKAPRRKLGRKKSKGRSKRRA